MKFGSSRILGLAVSERAIACAEVSVSGGAPVIRAQGTFDLPPELSAEQAGPIGDALAKFLRHHGFSCSRAVVGIPAKWLIAAEKEIPPTDEAQTRALLRLQAERMSGADAGEMVFDYVQPADRPLRGSSAGRVLMVGILKRQLQRVQRIAEAAGLAVVGVTSTGLAMASAMNSREPEASMLMLSRAGGEMVWRHHGAARMLRHIPLAVNGDTPAAIATMGTTLRRAVTMSAMTAGNAQGASPPTGGEIVMWDLIGLGDGQIDELSSTLGLTLRPANARSAFGVDCTIPKLNGDAADANFINISRCAPALAVALAGVRRALPIDLANSRLARPTERRLSRTAFLTIAVGAVILIGLGSLVYDVKSRQSELADLSAQLNALSGDRKLAETTLAKFNYGRGFFDARTPVLETLRELTGTFRDDEPIWATSFTLRENRTGSISGKATDQRFVISVYDRMKKNAKFADVTPPDMRDSGNTRAREVSFTINFRFKE